MKRVLIAAVSAALAGAAAWAQPPYVFEGTWGEEGSGNGEFKEPAGLDGAANGNVYVTDRENHRVQYFTADGSFLGKWGSEGFWNGQFNEPSSVKVAPNGNVYVADKFNHRIQYFRPNGSFLGKWGERGPADGYFESPWGLGFKTDVRCTSPIR
jgi:tripartite motif-containing protein 71